MGQKRNLPTQKNIIKHWNHTYETDFEEGYCWGCGFKSSLERCHIYDRHKSNDDSEDNLVILCKFCHNHLQDTQCITEKGREEFKKSIIEGLPYMSIVMTWRLEALKKGIYSEILTLHPFNQ